MDNLDPTLYDLLYLSILRTPILVNSIFVSPVEAISSGRSKLVDSSIFVPYAGSIPVFLTAISKFTDLFCPATNILPFCTSISSASRNMSHLHIFWPLQPIRLNKEIISIYVQQR